MCDASQNPNVYIISTRTELQEFERTGDQEKAAETDKNR